MALRNITPTIALPFDKGIVLPGVACIRSGTATYIDKYGNIQDASANAPRITYGLDGVCRGLLCEPTSTNVNTYSAYMFESGANDWLPHLTGTAASLTDTPYGSGSNMGTRVTFGATVNGGYKKTIVIAGTAVHTFSFIGRGDGTASISANGGINATVITLTDEWQLFQVSIAAANGAGNMLVIQKRSGDTATYCDVTAIQMEPLPYATSLIKTTTASVTRNFDDVDFTISSSVFKGDKGTWVIDYDIYDIPTATSKVLVAMSTSSGATDPFFTYYLRYPTATNIKLVGEFCGDTTTRLYVDFPTNPTINTKRRTAISFSSTQNDITPQQKMFDAGTLIQTVAKTNVMATSAAVAKTPGTKIYIGNNDRVTVGTPNSLCGCIGKITYYPAVLTDAEIAGL